MMRRSNKTRLKVAKRKLVRRIRGVNRALKRRMPRRMSRRMRRY